MKLIKARVTKFRNYVDSEELRVEDSITSLIGKNESGKTAFLKALYAIKPDIPSEAELNVDIDYPRWFKVRDARIQKSEGKSLENVPFVEAIFSLNSNDLSNLSNIMGIPISDDTELSISRHYDGKLTAELDCNEEKLIKSLFKSEILNDEIKKLLSDSNNKEDNIKILNQTRQEYSEEINKTNEIITQKNNELSEIEFQKNHKLEELSTLQTNSSSNENVNRNEPSEETDSDSNRENEINEEISKLDIKINEINEEISKFNEEITINNDKIAELDSAVTAFGKIQDTLEYLIPDEQIDSIIEILPKFFYFGSYNTLKGRIDLDKLITKPEAEIDKYDQTALALLKLVGVGGEELMDENYEIRKAELEAAASEVTRQVLNYWTQNSDLYVDLDTDQQTIQIPDDQGVMHDEVHRCLDVRLRDQIHQMTTNFSTRSSGFQWFFSFLVAFSDFSDQENVIILLDEPGLGLHGSAQKDLLNFIEKELGDGRQVIYTNHSPFMVNPKLLERVRLVEDNTSKEDPDLGSKILDEVLNVKRPETLFPLQAALGYDIAQNLFIGQYNLVVEGPSDFLYIDLISEFLKEKKMIYLNEKITITPVGGADKIPTFIALLGTHLDVSVLVDSNMQNNQKIQDMIRAGLLERQRFVTVGEITNDNISDIEDLFTTEEYLHLYNEAFGTTISISDLVGDDSVISRLTRHNGDKFNHYKPLQVLQKNPDELNRLSTETLERFEKLFYKLNKTFQIS